MTKSDAIKALTDHKICFEHDFGWNKTVLNALDTAIEALVADVVEIVRCGECKHWFDNGTDLCSCDRDALLRRRDFFCADGEQRESNGQ